MQFSFCLKCDKLKLKEGAYIMKFNIDLQIKDIYDERIKEHIHKLTNMYLDEVFKGNKVSFY